jgi:heterotetrameric sarcosine oxidase gamma subunit
VSLDFLTPDVAPGGSVLARSPMERLARQAGAQLSARDGWSVADGYADPAAEVEHLTETVGFADRSSLTKLELQAPPELLGRVVAQTAGGLVLEPGSAAHVEGAWWCPVTPARVLVLSEPAFAAPIRAGLAQAIENARGSVTVVDVTCGLAALSLLGPGARELLARFCAIDVRPPVTPPGGFRPGSIARTPGYLLVEARDNLLVLVGWAFGEYLWQVVADASAHLGGGPVGAEALARHLERADA